MLTCKQTGNYFHDTFGDVLWQARGYVLLTGLTTAITHLFPGTTSSNLNINSLPDFQLGIPFYRRSKDVGISIRAQSGSTGANAQYGFTINRKDASNLYYVLFQTQPTCEINFVKVVGGVSTTLLHVVATNPTATHKIKYRRRGNVHYVYLDDVLLNPGGTVDSSVLDLDTVDGNPGPYQFGLRVYNANVRFSSLDCWDEEDNLHVYVGAGNQGRIVDATGAVVVAAADADAAGWANLDISTKAYPFDGRVQKLVGGSVKDASVLYWSDARTGLMPGMHFSEDARLPVLNMQYLGKPELGDLSSYTGGVLNPCVWVDADGLIHLYAEGRIGLSSITSTDILHWTNSAWALTGWTRQANVAAFSGSLYGAPCIRTIDGQVVCVLQKYAFPAGVVHSEIYSSASADGGYTFDAPTRIAREDQSGGGTEYERLWGVTIAKINGAWFVWYEAAPLGNPYWGMAEGSVRRVAGLKADSFAGPWTYRGIVYDSYLGWDEPIMHSAGAANPWYFTHDGRHYILLDITQDGLWGALLAETTDGYSIGVLAREHITSGIGMNDVGANRKQVFSTRVCPAGSKLYAAYHSGDPGTQIEGLYLWESDLRPAAAGGSRSQIGGKSEVFGG